MGHVKAILERVSFFPGHARGWGEQAAVLLTRINYRTPRSHVVLQTPFGALVPRQ